MNIVLVNQYFPPDGAPTGVMLQKVAEELVRQGHVVTVLCGKGGYAEVGEKAADEARDLKYQVTRVGGTVFGRETFLGKITDYAFFYLGVAKGLAFMKQKPDRIIALTTPPYLSILARFFSKMRGGDHAHWVMDLYPDVMVAHGLFKSGGLRERFFGLLTRWGFGGKRSQVVLTLGPDMQKRTARHLLAQTPREWVPLWSSVEIPSEVVNDDVDQRGRVVLMYSGNMGLGHRFGEFLAAAASGEGEFEWKFCGQGKRRGEIEEFLENYPESSVSLEDYVPRESLPAHLATADVHLVSLDPSWDGTMLPSKLQGIFSIGKPVIFVGSETGTMGNWVAESGGGWIVEPDDVESMREALAAASDAEVRREKGEAALNYACKHFNASKNAGRIAGILGG